MAGVKITDTILKRCASVFNSNRNETGGYAPIAEKLDNVGFYAFEGMGGASSCLRFFKWRPLGKIRALEKLFLKRLKLQMLLRDKIFFGTDIIWWCRRRNL